MNKSVLVFTINIALAPGYLWAADLSWGDPETKAGQFNISGAVRTRYLNKDYQDKANEGSQNNDWRLADIKLTLGYENPDWVGAISGHCYRYDQLCDAVFLRDAWAGYKFGDNQRVSIGLQPIDFGFGRFWGSTYNETLMNTIGFEDISNLGIRYQTSHNDYNLAVGFYPRDGGNYKGTSKDSSRYSGNFVEADDLTTGTNIEEKNMWIGRVSKKVMLNESRNFSTELGASYWYSELDNKRTHRNGHRNTWNIFAQTQYDAWQWMTLYGQQRIKNRDDLFPDSSTIGAFDYPYQLANKGSYIVNEINYSVRQPFYQLENIKPYISHSRLFKDKSGYQDSDRLIAGIAFNYKSIGVQVEHMWSRNDPMFGASADGLAQGDHNGWNKLFYLAVGYYF